MNQVEANPLKNQVAILDAGAQYGKVIDRRVRELAVESHLLPMNTHAGELSKYGAIIISGGPESVYGEHAPKYDPQLFELGMPILGICYGMQLFSHTQGGKVEKKSTREDGPCEIQIDTTSPLFHGLDKRQQVLMTHGDTVDQPGTGFRVIAMSGELIAGIENVERGMYGVQFHPEVDLTEHGVDVLANFLFKIAKLEANYTMANRQERAIAEIRQQIGKRKALVLVSGGVDSTVAAALVTKALGPDQIIAIHIDHGLMRLDESAKVVAALREIGVPVQLIEAQKEFAEATTIVDGVKTPPLNQCVDPEQKRKIIGDTFMKVAEEVVAKLNLKMDEVCLVQGSLRPDLIESGAGTVSATAETIKTHHNNSASVRALRDANQISEPLADYHKDEVRVLGAELGLPEEIVWRQPFPGPGLGIRVICAEQPYLTKNYAEVASRLAEFGSPNLATALLPIQTVGIQGDGRTYSYLAALSGEANWPELRRLALEIPKKIHAINRVVYLFGEKQNGLHDLEQSITPTHLTVDVLDQLRQADQIVNGCLRRHNLLRKLSQVPVISFPVHFGEAGKRSIGIRTFLTRDFMTGLPAVPGGKEMPVEVLEEMVERILAEVPGVVRVAYDLTSKPPGTTEWE